MSNKWKIWIDTGGTFTDCLAYDPKNHLHRIKILSSGRLRGNMISNNGSKLQVAVSWPVRDDVFDDYQLQIDQLPDTSFRILNSNLKEGLISIDADPGVLKEGGFEIFSGEEAPIMAARLATKTLLNTPLPPLDMRLGSTKGTNALLERKGAEVGLILTNGFHDLVSIGTQQRKDIFALNAQKDPSLYSEVFEIEERISNDGSILIPLEQEGIDQLLTELKREGIETVAVSLMNGSHNDAHERELEKQLVARGFPYTSISTGLANEIGIINRCQTTIVNAYLSKIIDDYLSRVKDSIAEGNLKVMTSAGGLVDAENFLPKDSLLSGPAGGVAGSARIAEDLGISDILTFDMGGTSTDVSRFSGKFDYNFITEINNITLYSPTLAIETVAAGGGSICAFDGYKLTVGPESAGAYPGPACYGNNGPLAITDVNLLLGRLEASNFSIPLDVAASNRAFAKVKAQMSTDVDDENILTGFLRIANEKMAEAIRKISISKGYDPTTYSLLAFGGAGGQHACDVSELLGIQQIVIPYEAGLLSAYGIGKAEIERIVQSQLLKPLEKVEQQIDQLFAGLESEAVELLTKEGVDDESVYVRNRLVYLRFKGQEHSIEVEYVKDQLKETFKEEYAGLYGHWLDQGDIEVESIKLIAASGETMKESEKEGYEKYQPTPNGDINTCTSSGWKRIPIYTWELLEPGAIIGGPALLQSNNSTVFIEEGWNLSLREGKNAVLDQVQAKVDTGESLTEMAELELFINRYKAVADDMGAILQRCAFSVNVKDRMDFSCAVLDANGYLIANAPHIPVHLGSLGVCVRDVMQSIELEEGDVIITNHPAFGGSHLPDVTLLAPVYYEGERIAFVANRAHHAELGGKTPGSMPADANNLAEEGVVIKPMKLVEKGQSRWDEIRSLLSSPPHPTRALEENLADLNGALASIQVGIQGVQELCRLNGKPMVTTYMGLLLDYSGKSIFKTFQKLSNDRWSAEEFLDDGSKIAVSISKSDSGVEFDFDGTSPTHPGNLNATRAILNSAIIYVLRLMLEEPLPLNEGIMKYVTINVPECMLNPEFDEDPSLAPAVVGGNTETSQRVVDTLIKALKLVACSQGTMNNLIFGNERFGFYETIGGGVGAGDGFDGADAVHQHMTNTKITDPEVMEFRYPVVVEKVLIREGSGGNGKWKGGNGIIRQLRFTEDVTLSVLSQHRKEAPFGLTGGSTGKVGEQYLIRSSGEEISLTGCVTIEVRKGEAIRIETPGGGGYGTPKA